MVVEVPGPGGRPISIAGNPIKLDGGADPPTRPPAPALDADRDRILRELAEPGPGRPADPARSARESR
jgi:CoA:oxalate CoA-transferase